jgi:hypothetical protein
MNDDARPSRLGSRAARAAIVALSAALIVTAAAHRQSWNRAHRDAVGLLASTGLGARQTGVAADASRDPDPLRSRLAVARGLLAEAYDPEAFSKLPLREAADAASRLEERLELARSIAADALVRIPAAWEAAMILGSTTNRIWSIHGDPRLVTERSVWESPLQAAARLAPGQDEPLGPLAVAWLETWPLVPPEGHAEARDTLRRAFADPGTFRRCAPMWLVAAADREEAFSLVPDSPSGWSVVEDVEKAREDWDGFSVARRRRDEAAGRLAELRVREAADRLRGGDPTGARSVALSVVGDLPPDRRFVPVLRAALAQCPPGPISGSPPAIRRWVDLALDGFIRGETWVPPDLVARLAASAGDLPAAVAAVAALASGDLSGAEVIERRAEADVTEAWAPYWLAKARVLARAHRTAEGIAALRRVNRSWAVSLPVIEARVAVAEASGDANAVSSAVAELDGAAAASWRITDWVWRGGAARLDLCAVRDAPGFDLTLDSFPPRGTVVEVRLDGAPVALAPALDREGLSVSAAISKGAHLVEVTTIAGGRVVPGDLTLTP